MISRPDPSRFPALQETGYLPYVTGLFELVQFKYDSLKKKIQFLTHPESHSGEGLWCIELY